jgi:probable nitrogen fixation protein
MTTSEPIFAQAGDAAVLAAPFLKALAGLVRSEDSYGTWDKKRDADLLAAFILTREARRAMPIIADPDPDALHRVEQYYQAIGLVIEQRIGLMASPMLKMSHEGFGRVIVTVGKLVVIAKTLRDVHRFGFDSLAALDAEGEKAVERAIATVNTYPAVARD